MKLRSPDSYRAHRVVLRPLRIFVFGVLASASLPTSNAWAVTILSTLDVTAPTANTDYWSETGLQTDRLFRSGTASACGAPKANPGLNGAGGSRQYDVYGFVALEDGCVTVTLTTAGVNNLFHAAYNVNRLAPANPSANYLADPGTSPVGTPVDFSFDVTAGDVFYIVVHEVNPGGGIGQVYTLDVDGVKLQPDFAVTTTLDVTTPPAGAAYFASTQLQTGRLDRTGVVSTCTAPKANPGLFTPFDSRRADVYEFIPVSSGCAIVSLSHTGTDQAHVVVYDENGFNQNDPSENYLADSGSSAINFVRSFSLNVRAGHAITIVVHEVNPGAGVGSSYNLHVSGPLLTYPITITETLDGVSPAADALYAVSTGLQDPRLNRNGVVSTCADPKVNPGLGGDAGVRRFDEYVFTPPASGCVEASLEVSQPTNIFAVAYNDLGFVPGSPDSNYLADPGLSVTTTTTVRSWSFDVTGGIPFSLVAHETNSGGAPGHEYTLTVRSIVYAFLGTPFFEDGFESGNLSGWTTSTP